MQHYVEQKRMKNESIVIIRLSEILYYISFSLILMAKGLGFYDGQPFFKICLLLSIAAWIGKMWLTQYTIKEFAMIFGLVGLGGLVYLVSGEKGALLYILMITGLKNVPIRRVFTIGAAVFSISFLGTAWLNALHLIDGPFKVHEKLGMGMIIRWGLGQSHPNVLHISFLVFVMLAVYLLGNKFSWKTAAFLMAGNILIFLYSVSSTGVIAVTFYLMLSVYWRYRKKLGAVERILIQLVLPMCLIYSLLAPLMLQGELFEKVNDITNTRLSLARRFLTTNPITPFGTKLSEIITSQLTMDNAYVFAFVTYGIVLFAVIVVAYFLLVHKYCKEQKGGELSIMLACFLAGIMEPFLFNTSYKNISLLFMKALLFEEEKETAVRMPGYFDKEYKVSFEKIYQIAEDVKKVIRNRKKVILILLLAGILAGSFGYQLLYERPQRILVPESACDVGVIQRTEESLETVYLALEENVTAETDQVIGFVNEEMRMIIYSGGIVQMEYIRGLVCSGMTTGTVLIALAIAIFRRKEKAPVSKEKA